MSWPDLDGVERELRHVAAELQSLDLWPPWDAVRTVARAFGTVARIAAEPPAPDPAAVLAAAADFARVGVEVGYADSDVDDFRARLGPGVWRGDAGDAARASLEAFTRRDATLGVAATTVASVLRRFADDMGSARARHRRAYGELDFTTDFGFHVDPMDYVHDLQRAVGRFRHGLDDLIGSYADASDAVATASRAIHAAIETIDLPEQLAPGEGAVATIDGWSGRKGGPLRGTVLQRAQRRLAAMSPADRRAAQGLVDAAPNDQARAWIMAAIASGADPATLRRFAAKVDTMTPAQLAALDPTTGTSYTEGSDATTCGSDSLVISKMINDPVYAMAIVTGYDARTGQELPNPDPSDPDPVHARFLAAANQMHDRTNSWRDHNGHPQLPWPESLGTTPAAVANEMNGPGGAGTPGVRYTSHLVDPGNLGAEYDRISRSVDAGNTVPLFVGNGTAPRHVVLVTATDGDTMTAYDPSRGTTYTFSRADFEGNRLDLGGWTQAWADVVPAA